MEYSTSSRRMARTASVSSRDFRRLCKASVLVKRCSWWASASSRGFNLPCREASTSSSIVKPVLVKRWSPRQEVVASPRCGPLVKRCLFIETFWHSLSRDISRQEPIALVKRPQHPLSREFLVERISFVKRSQHSSSRRFLVKRCQHSSYR